jgi:SOS-response transcriptional repressor LexA
MRPPLTTKQAAMLDEIRDWITTHRGVAPSRRELARKMGKSVGTIQAHLERLAQKGYAIIHQGERQGITLTPRD